MKIRSDFVSNSSTCSFMVSPPQGSDMVFVMRVLKEMMMAEPSNQECQHADYVSYIQEELCWNIDLVVKIMVKSDDCKRAVLQTLSSIRGEVDRWSWEEDDQPALVVMKFDSFCKLFRMENLDELAGHFEWLEFRCDDCDDTGIFYMYLFYLFFERNSCAVEDVDAGQSFESSGLISFAKHICSFAPKAAASQIQEIEK